MKPDIRLDDEAIDWVVRLHSGHVTREDRRAFAVWRRQSAAHDAAAESAETLWRDVGKTATAVQFARRTEASSAHSSRRAAMGRRAMLVGSIAAGAAALLVASGAVGPMSAAFADYATRPGERRKIALPDGSTVYLNTSSAISVAFSERERRLSLDAGEAMFEVAKDRARPFVVGAADGEARAVGTVFSVRRKTREVAVAVSEGVVDVGIDGGDVAHLAAGQGISYGDGQFTTRVEAVDTAALTAWQRGKLIFNRRPLAEVAEELERYQIGRVIVANEALRTLPVTGVFDLDDPDGTLKTIEDTLQVKATRLPFATVLR